MEDIEDMGGAQAPSIDLLAILRACTAPLEARCRHNAVCVDCNIWRCKADRAVTI